MVPDDHFHPSGFSIHSHLDDLFDNYIECIAILCFGDVRKAVHLFQVQVSFCATRWQKRTMNIWTIVMSVNKLYAVLLYVWGQLSSANIYQHWFLVYVNPQVTAHLLCTGQADVGCSHREHLHAIVYM
jgi:hypothetical protein